MAALDTPWLSMSAPRISLLHPEAAERHGASNHSPLSPLADSDSDPYAPKPTYATFSPVTAFSGTTTMASSAAKRRSVILVHQKSPLLLATPPQITRALAYSHPFVLPLNKLAGLISWTTGDAWESFVMVLVWWGLVLYGDSIMRAAGPILLVLTLIVGMYGRRYSPLSSSGWSTDDGVAGSGGRDGSDSGSGSSNGGFLGTGSLSYFFFGYGAGAGGSTGAAAPADPKGRTRAKNKNAGGDTAGGTGPGNGSASGTAHQRNVSEVATNTRHQKTLDEIVDTLKEFTARCNLLLEPLLELTDFLSTQSTPTSATTRPALTVLFVRILLCTPFWFALTLPPLRIVTTRRVVLVLGTVVLTWHSQAMRISRTILWRSATVRRVAVLVTGLALEEPSRPVKSPPYVTAGLSEASSEGATSAAAAAAVQSKLSSSRRGRAGPSTPRESELTKAIRRARAGHDAGVRFTFILYENQRRWVGLGWTTSLFTYERPSWTDEHNNAVPSKDEFELPEVEDGSKMRWRWVEGSRWRVDGVVDDAVRSGKVGPFGEHTETWDYDGDGGRMGWVYYDNKWQNGRRGQDSWNRWTRRRKWYRDAELVEVDEAEDSSLGSIRSGARSRGSSSATARTATVAADKTDKADKVDKTEATPALTGADGTADGHDDTDAMSLLSTSSRSGRGGRGPLLRRRVTDASVRAVAAPAVTTTATAMAIGNGRRDGDGQEEDAAVLSSSAGVKLNEPKVGSWGIGDEAQMSLE